jgi:hypothetical protein
MRHIVTCPLFLLDNADFYAIAARESTKSAKVILFFSWANSSGSDLAQLC